MLIAHFSRTFSAAHRLWNDDSKCRNIHGHNFRVEVKIDAPIGSLNAQGFVVPFEDVKRVIDGYDHALILDLSDPFWNDPAARAALDSFNLRVVTVPFPPSTENMALLLAYQLAALVEGADVSVKLRETEGIAAYGRASI